MLERVGPFKTGEPVRAGWLQQMLEAVRGLANMRVMYPLQLKQTPGGAVLSMQESSAGTLTRTHFFSANYTANNTAVVTCPTSMTLASGSGLWLVSGWVDVYYPTGVALPDCFSHGSWDAQPGYYIDSGAIMGFGATGLKNGSLTMRLCISPFNFTPNGSLNSILSKVLIYGGGATPTTIQTGYTAWQISK